MHRAFTLVYRKSQLVFKFSSATAVIFKLVSHRPLKFEQKAQRSNKVFVVRVVIEAWYRHSRSSMIDDPKEVGLY